MQSRRTWDRLHWDQQAGGDITARLKENAQKLMEFYKSLSESDQVVVEQALEQMAAEIRSGRGDATSVVTFGTSSGSSDSEDSGWMEILRDLQDLGVSEATARDHKGFIVEWILRAINMGWLEEKIPDEPVSTPPIVVPHLSASPPIPPKLPNPNSPYAGPSPSLSQRRSRIRSQVSLEDLRGIGIGANDQPPSPMEQETNILWNAQLIVQYWQSREWAQARSHLQEQVKAVNRGETITVGSIQVQPDVRILRHLIGICYSYEGDFIGAKDAFQLALRGAYVSGLALDDGDIAALRWLGETCIMLNEPHNAAMAWAISVLGVLNNYGPQRNIPSKTLNDLRTLNSLTGGLSALRTAFVRYNRDASTILGQMLATDKYHAVLTAMNSIMNGNNEMYQSSWVPSNNTAISEGFLTQPLVSQNSWPLPQDPFFRSHSAITLLSILSRPKSEIPYKQIAQGSFGIKQTKQLTYATRLGLEWLVETIRVALNTYAIDWKTHGMQLLCRVSHAHQHIAYYEVYGITFKKLAFRNICGFKITDRLYATRGFVVQPAASTRPVTFHGDAEHVEHTKKGLGDRLTEFLTQAERYKAEGKTPPWDMPVTSNERYELANTVSPKPQGAELPADAVYELPAVQAESAELQARSYEIGDSHNVAELPA